MAYDQAAHTEAVDSIDDLKRVRPRAHARAKTVDGMVDGRRVRGTSRSGGAQFPKVRYPDPMERTHPKLDRLTFDPEKCAGKACIRGMRITAESLVRYLAAGMTTAEILAEWPDLEEEDIRQSLQYAAWLASDRVLDAA